MATPQPLVGTELAAEDLGVTQARVRQIIQEIREKHPNFATKIGKTWLLTPSEMEYIRNLPDGRTSEFRKFPSKTA